MEEAGAAAAAEGADHGLEDGEEEEDEEEEGLSGTKAELFVRGDENDAGAVEGVDESVGAVVGVTEAVGTGCFEGKLLDGRLVGLAAVGGPS